MFQAIADILHTTKNVVESKQTSKLIFSYLSQILRAVRKLFRLALYCPEQL